MAETYLRVSLGVQPTQGGAAELVPPPELAGVDFRYVVVKEGGEEGVVVVDGEPSLIARLQTAPAITKLTAGRLAAVRDGYPPPRLKQRYRLQTAAPVEEALVVPVCDRRGGQAGRRHPSDGPVGLLPHRRAGDAAVTHSPRALEP